MNAFFASRCVSAAARRFPTPVAFSRVVGVAQKSNFSRRVSDAAREFARSNARSFFSGVTPSGLMASLAVGGLLGHRVAKLDSEPSEVSGPLGENVYEHRFVTDIPNAEDLAEFYGAEDFMEVFGVIPSAALFFLRRAEFDEEGIAHTYGLPVGTLDIELKFTQEEQEDEDGEDENIVAFNKMMKWDNQSPFSDVPLWNMRHDFGFKEIDEGVFEITHKGSDYNGPAFLKWVWRAHSWYAAKATEIYINRPEFSQEDSHPREKLRQTMIFRVGGEVLKDVASSFLERFRCTIYTPAV